MKLCITIFVIFSLSFVTSNPGSNLKNDIDEFIALVPKEEIIALYQKYENDDDFKTIVAYLKSKNFAKVAHIVVNTDEVKDLVNYLEENGVPIIDVLNKLADRFGLPHWGSYSDRYTRSTHTLCDFLFDFKAIMPMRDIVTLALTKISTSEDFQNLYWKVADMDYQKLHDAALTHPEIVELIEGVTMMGVDVDKMLKSIKIIFGWN